MTVIEIAVLLLAVLAFAIRRNLVPAGWALLALFAGLYAAHTQWLGPHLYAVGAWVSAELGRIRL